MTDKLRKPATLEPLRRHGGSAATLLDDPSADVFPHDQRTFGRTASAVVEDISADGTPMVILTGEPRSCEALSVLRFPTAHAAVEALLGRTVVVFVNESSRPVILGVVAERLWDTPEGAGPIDAQATLPPGEPVAVHADKRRLDLEATDEIRLTCGKSSLVMRRDGTVIVRGVNIVSRALQAHKIRGATVNVN
jgi:hypothetical protein